MSCTQRRLPGASAVEIVRSDGGTEFEGNFAKFRSIRGNKHECTTTVSPEFSAVAERALGLIDAVTCHRIVQARRLRSHVRLSPIKSQWAEPYRWMCDALNRSATSVTLI